jgi:hypothetical protein
MDGAPPGWSSGAAAAAPLPLPLPPHDDAWRAAPAAAVSHAWELESVLWSPHAMVRAAVLFGRAGDAVGAA